MAKARVKKSRSGKRIGRPPGSKNKPKAVTIVQPKAPQKKGTKRNFLGPRILYKAGQILRESTDQFAGMTRKEVAKQLSDKLQTRISEHNVKTIGKMIGMDTGIGQRRQGYRKSNGSIRQQINDLLKSNAILNRSVDRLMHEVFGNGDR